MQKIEIAQNIWTKALPEITKTASGNDAPFFTQITCEGIEGEGSDETLCLCAASDWAEVWVNRNYNRHEKPGDISWLDKHITLAAGRQMRCRVRSAAPPAPEADAVAAVPPAPRPAPPRAHAHPVANSINPANTFENFMTGSENQLAHSAALAVATAPGSLYNPLFIYGNTGLGKTHLLHAIANAALAHTPSTRILYVTSEAFTNEYIETVKHNDYHAFRARYREADYLLIDDIQFLANRERTQEEFFHTFNTLHTSRKQIVITSDRPAKEIANLEDRLVSRFEWGFTADIQPPRLETRIAILSKKAEAVGLDLPADILVFLAERIYRNVRNLEGAILKLNGYQKLTLNNSALRNEPPPPLTREKVQEILHDILADEVSDRITPERIQKIVAEFYKLDPAEMTGKRRTETIAFVRQIAMFLTKQTTTLSLSTIGAAFGGRDHGTVIHAIRTVEHRMTEKTSVKTDVNLLTDRILHPRA